MRERQLLTRTASSLCTCCAAAAAMSDSMCDLQQPERHAACEQFAEVGGETLLTDGCAAALSQMEPSQS
jgi:hypothetical protein